MGQHLVFYDGKCGFCDRSVNFLMEVDKKELFVFAPLQGETAKRFEIPALTEEDTLVLIEDYKSQHPKVYILGQAVFRILWLLGGFFALLGWISFMPPILYNWGYRLVARNRGKLFSIESCRLPTKEKEGRFLK